MVTFVSSGCWAMTGNHRSAKHAIALATIARIRREPTLLALVEAAELGGMAEHMAFDGLEHVGLPLACLQIQSRIDRVQLEHIMVRRPRWRTGAAPATLTKAIEPFHADRLALCQLACFPRNAVE